MALSGLQGDVLVGRGVGEIRDQAEARFSDPRPDRVDEGELPDRRGERAPGDELLDLVQDRLALGMVQLGRLLLEQLVDVGVAAVNISATLDDKGRETRRRVAEGAAAALDQVLEALVRPSLQKSS